MIQQTSTMIVARRLSIVFCCLALVISQFGTCSLQQTNEMSTRARSTRDSKRKAPLTPEQEQTPLPGHFTRKRPFTCLMVDKNEHHGAFSCHECDLRKERHGFKWTLERPTHLVCKGGHTEDQIVYKNKYEWAQKKLKTPVASENGAPVVIPTYNEARTTNNSPEGRTSTAEIEIAHRQLDTNDTNTPPPPLQKFYIKDEQLQQEWTYLKSTII
jgi:hypothetical protein